MAIKNNTIFLIAHNIRSIFNVGSIFRSAEVFGVEKIYLCGYTASPPRKDLSKTALGAEHLVPWEYSKQPARIIQKLKHQKIQVIALETKKEAIPLPAFMPSFPIALLVGNEVTGIPSRILELCDAIVKIPLLGKKESLNVSVAASIAMYSLRYSQLTPTPEAS